MVSVRICEFSPCFQAFRAGVGLQKTCGVSEVGQVGTGGGYGSSCVCRLLQFGKYEHGV